MKISFFLIASALFLTGCSSADYYAVTYATVPEGATIICNGVDEGYSPVDLNYKLDDKDRAYGSFMTRPCKAVWSSGASSDFDNVYDLNKYPRGVISTITRKSGKGLGQDKEFADRLKLIRLVAEESTIPVEYQNYLQTGNDAFFPVNVAPDSSNLIRVDSNLFYNTDTGSYTASPDPFLAPHIDPHVLPHTVPHVDPHWAPHNLPHILPHLK